MQDKWWVTAIGKKGLSIVAAFYIIYLYRIETEEAKEGIRTIVFHERIWACDPSGHHWDY